MPGEEEQIINLIAEELTSGRPPEMVVEELVQAGLPREDATQVVQAVQREIGKRGAGRAPGAPKPPSRKGIPWGYVFMVIAILVLLYILLFVE